MKNSQLLQFILSSFVLFILGFGFTANAQAYFCGSTAKGGMGRVGYYIYPRFTIELDFTAKNTTVNVKVDALTVPNKFTIYDSATGAQLVTSGWIGVANYPGPWGQSINTPPAKIISFAKGNSNLYSLKVETSVTSVADTCSALISCAVVTPTVSLTSVTDQNIRNTMTASFQSLSPAVNFVELSAELGINYTLTSNDIDFQNLQKSIITNDNDSGYAIVANFKKNSNDSSKNFTFLLGTDGTTYGNPTIVKVVTGQTIEYYDMTTAKIARITNYTSTTNLTTDVRTGQFRTAGSGPCTGQAVLNCVNDAYSNHGWASVWAWVQSAFMPATVAAISAACFTKICIPH